MLAVLIVCCICTTDNTDRTSYQMENTLPSSNVLASTSQSSDNVYGSCKRMKTDSESPICNKSSEIPASARDAFFAMFVINDINKMYTLRMFSDKTRKTVSYNKIEGCKNYVTSDRDNNDAIINAPCRNIFQIRNKSFLDIQKSLVNHKEDESFSKMHKNSFMIAQCGLILGVLVEESVGEKEIEPFLMDKKDRTESYKEKFISLLNKYDKKLLNNALYGSMTLNKCLLTILFFIDKHPEILRNNQNEYINICHTRIARIVIDHLIKNIPLVMKMLMCILDFEKNSEYIDVIIPHNYTLMVMSSFMELYELIYNLGQTTEEIIRSFKMYNYTIVCVFNPEEFIFIDEMINYILNDRIKKIEDCYMNISDDDKKKFSDYMDFLKKQKIMANLMIKGHDNLCKLIGWNIQHVKNQDMAENKNKM